MREDLVFLLTKRFEDVPSGISPGLHRQLQAAIDAEDEHPT